MRIVPLADIAASDVESLLDRAFGPNRHARTAYRIRVGLSAIPSLSFAGADADGRLIASIQCWPVDLETDDGARVPMVMVGPVAVEPAIQRGGLGRALMTHMLFAAQGDAVPGSDALMLVGDPEYYGRFFGFDAGRTARWRLPGPFEPRRLLARGPGVPDVSGTVVARGHVDA